MKWTADSKRTWIVAGLMALLALGLAPGGTRAERERVQARAEGGEFYGVVTSIPGTAGWIGDWTVDGRTGESDVRRSIGSDVPAHPD